MAISSSVCCVNMDPSNDAEMEAGLSAPSLHLPTMFELALWYSNNNMWHCVVAMDSVVSLNCSEIFIVKISH